MRVGRRNADLDRNDTLKEDMLQMKVSTVVLHRVALWHVPAAGRRLIKKVVYVAYYYYVTVLFKKYYLSPSEL